MVIVKIIKNWLLKHFTLRKIYNYTCISHLFDTGQGFSFGIILPPRDIWQYLGTFLIVMAGWGCCCCHLVGSRKEAKDMLLNIFQFTGQYCSPSLPHNPQTKNSPGQNVHSARVRKPWSKVKAFSWYMNPWIGTLH